LTKDTVTAVEHSSAEQWTPKHLLSQAEFPEGKPRIRLADFDPSYPPFVGPTPESAEQSSAIPKFFRAALGLP